MTGFVLDNSVSMRWLLESAKAVDQRYAEMVLKSMTDADAVVPNIWHLEATNVLLGAEKRLEVNAGEIEGFITQLESLPLHVDSLTSHQAFSRIMALSRIYKLSSYDGVYLELAIREGLPLATLDKDLRKSAKNAGVDLYLK